MSDEAGVKVWSAAHDPFGQATVDEDVDGNGNPVALPVRFPGQYYDQETGLHYNWHRYYDPATGRYIISDPIGLGGGDLNLYSYVFQNPVNGADPTGEACGTGLCVGGGLLARQLLKRLLKPKPNPQPVPSPPVIPPSPIPDQGTPVPPPLPMDGIGDGSSDMDGANPKDVRRACFISCEAIWKAWSISCKGNSQCLIAATRWRDKCIDGCNEDFGNACQ